MKPKIGVIVCGFIENKQFVTNAYIQSVRYSGGIPLILPLIRSGPVLNGTNTSASATASCSAVEMTSRLCCSDKSLKKETGRPIFLWISSRSGS